MNKKLPFEEALEQRLSNLPLPAEEQSWQDMKRLLDKDKKRFFPFGFRGYGAVTLLAVLLCAGLWIALRKNESKNVDAVSASINTHSSNKNNSQKGPQQVVDKVTGNEIFSTKKIHESVAVAETNPIAKENKSSAISLLKDPPNANIKSTSNDNGIQANSQTNNTKSLVQNIPGATQTKLANSLGSSPIVKTKTGQKGLRESGRVNNSSLSKTISTSKNDNQTVFSNNGIVKQSIGIAINNENDQIASSKADLTNVSTDQATLVKVGSSAKIDPSAAQKTEPTSANNFLEKSTTEGVNKNKSNTDIETAVKKREIHSDSMQHTSKDSLTNNTPISTGAKSSQAQATPKKEFYWSAGLGVQQQIPVNGQHIVAYNYNGTKGILDDYIPGLYLRFEKPGKWFFQAEFNYGAPQSVQSFSFNRKTTLDNSFTNFTTTNLNIKKIYYHEIPLSFNYYILPKLSIGVGGIYSILHRSITEQQVLIQNIQTHQEISTAKIIASPYSDSFLYKSQMRWTLQTDYQWRKLSLGLRYTRDCESYIKYTLPDGSVNDKKNWSLEFILKFRLWKSWKG